MLQKFCLYRGSSGLTAYTGARQNSRTPNRGSTNICSMRTFVRFGQAERMFGETFVLEHLFYKKGRAVVSTPVLICPHNAH